MLLLALCLSSGPDPVVKAQTIPGAKPVAKVRPDPPDAGRRTAAAALAIVPGVLVPGGGHLLLGDSAGARKMLLLKGTGLATFFAGFLPILYSNASDKVMHASYPVAIGGFGLFAIATLGDLYGACFSGRPPGRAPAFTPDLELEQHWMHVADDQFGYDHFWHVGLTGRVEGARLRGDFFHSPTDGNTRMVLEAAWRFFGARPQRARTTMRDGSFLELSAALTRHAFPAQRFTVNTPELFLLGRLDLRRLAPSLAGSFAEMGVGLGIEFTDFVDVGGGPDRAQLLLFQVAYGLYLGSGVRAGEAKLFYNHRHDDWAGGMQGVLGYFGVSGRVNFSRNWGLDAVVERGSATRIMLGAVFRY